MSLNVSTHRFILSSRVPHILNLDSPPSSQTYPNNYLHYNNNTEHQQQQQTHLVVSTERSAVLHVCQCNKSFQSGMAAFDENGSTQQLISAPENLCGVELKVGNTYILSGKATDVGPSKYAPPVFLDFLFYLVLFFLPDLLYFSINVFI